MSIQWQTANGSALAGQDYVGASGTLTWTDGDVAPKSISVASLNNPAIGPSKSFSVTLSSPTQGATVAGSPSATVSLTAQPCNAWLFAHFGAGANNAALAAESADPDGDGLANLLEYVLGAVPDAPSSASVPIRGTVSVAGQSYLTLTFTRDTGVTDASCIVQQSLDLQTWNDGSSYRASGGVASNAFTVEVSRVPAGSGRETVTVRDTQPLSSSGSFLRLKATRP